MASHHIILNQSHSFSATSSSKNKAQHSSSSVPQEASPEKLQLQTSPPECIWGKQLVSGESFDSIQMNCGGIKGIPTYVELSLLLCWVKVLDLCELLKTVRWILPSLQQAVFPILLSQKPESLYYRALRPIYCILNAKGGWKLLSILCVYFIQLCAQEHLRWRRKWSKTAHYPRKLWGP